MLILDNHPDNTQNKFKITLQSPIELQGQWETGLAQLICPHSWHEQLLKEPANNHHHHLFLIKLHIKDDGGNDMSKVTYWRDLHVTPRNYYTIKDLLLAIRLECEFSKRNAVQFIYRALGGISGPVDMEHLRITCIDGAFLALPIELAKVLSYDVEKMEKEQWTQVGGISIQQLPTTGTTKWCVIGTPTRGNFAGRQSIPAPLSEHIVIKLIEAEKDRGLFQNMYINSDLIEAQYIGNTRANVLRVIAPTKKKGQIETFNFDPIFYSPLRVTKFNTVEINITGDTGQLIPFDGGVVVVVLHLRRKHNILV